MLKSVLLNFTFRVVDNMIATGQEKSGKKILHGQGKVREFHSESGESEILRVAI